MKYIIVFLLTLGAIACTAKAYEVTLGWDFVGYAAGFHMYQLQSNDCSDVTKYTKLATSVSGTDRYARIANLQPGLPYCWYITAYTPSAESSSSNRVYIILTTLNF